MYIVLYIYILYIHKHHVHTYLYTALNNVKAKTTLVDNIIRQLPAIIVYDI